MVMVTQILQMVKSYIFNLLRAVFSLGLGTIKNLFFLLRAKGRCVRLKWTDLYDIWHGPFFVIIAVVVK